ncbi:MAG: sterol desaturase family protein [Bacteroidota bacterium]
MSTKKLYVSNSSESIRLFEAGWMESLSKVHYSVPLFIYIPVITISTAVSIRAGISAIDFVAWGALGFLAWTVVEYVMHRWVFHFHPKSDWGKKLHFIFHGIHHDYPCDKLRLVLPPSVSIPLATGFFFLWRSFIPAPGLFAFFATFILGYLIYDMFHYAIHHVEVKGKLWNALKTHHLKHHYVDPDRGFGVSSPLWDLIIRSNFENGKENKHATERTSVATEV